MTSWNSPRSIKPRSRGSASCENPEPHHNHLRCWQRANNDRIRPATLRTLSISRTSVSERDFPSSLARAETSSTLPAPPPPNAQRMIAEFIARAMYICNAPCFAPASDAPQHPIAVSVKVSKCPLPLVLRRAIRKRADEEGCKLMEIERTRPVSVHRGNHVHNL